MSLAEISDNRYEVEASKPPLKTMSAITQMGMMLFFVVGGLWIGMGVLKGILFTPKETESSIEKQFREMKSKKAAPAAAPAAAAPAAAAPAAAAPTAAPAQ